MHSHRLNLPLLLPCRLSMSTQSCFLGTTSIGLAKLLILHEMMPTFSSCFISWSTNSQYFSGTVHVIDVTGGPCTGMSNSIRLVLPISVTFWEIIWGYFLFRSSRSFILAPLQTSASGMELTEDSSCTMVFCGTLGSHLEVFTSESAQADLLDLITLPHKVHRHDWHVFANTAWNIFGIEEWNAECWGVLCST